MGAVQDWPVIGIHNDRTAPTTSHAGFTTGYALSGEPLLVDTDRLLVGRFEPRWRSLGTFALKLATSVWRRP